MQLFFLFAFFLGILVYHICNLLREVFLSQTTGHDKDPEAFWISCAVFQEHVVKVICLDLN